MQLVNFQNNEKFINEKQIFFFYNVFKNNLKHITKHNIYVKYN